MTIDLAVLIATPVDGSPLQYFIVVGFVGVVILGVLLLVSILRGRLCGFIRLRVAWGWAI